jgi:hypothetical protein
MIMDVSFSEHRGNLFAALSKAQADITGAVKDSSNPFFKSKYADLAACLDAVRGPLAKNELCVIQTTSNESGSVTVITTLGHSSGEWMTGQLTMTPEKAGPQAFGACITYARRYALAAITGLAQIDDDAEAATAHKGAPDIIPEKVWGEAEKKANEGLGALSVWWETKTKPQKEIIAADGKRWDKLKSKAADIDAKRDEAA